MSRSAFFIADNVPTSARLWRKAVRSAGLLALSVAFGLDQATAAVLHSENFSVAPADLNSGNWNSNITDGAVPAPGVWSTAGGYAASTNSGGGIVQANAQYSFDAGDFANFGALYDADSGTIGGGNVSGSLYLRFEVQLLHPDPAGNLGPHFGGLQLFRGATSNRAILDNYGAGGGLAMSVGKNWGSWGYSYVVHGAAGGDLNALGHPDPAPYAEIDAEWHTVVARIDYNAAAGDSATVWFDPDFTLTELEQSSAITTALPAGAGNFSFNTFVLRAGNNGMSGNFADILFATEPTDVGFAAVPEPATWLLAMLAVGGCWIARSRPARDANGRD